MPARVAGWPCESTNLENAPCHSWERDVLAHACPPTQVHADQGACGHGSERDRGFPEVIQAGWGVGGAGPMLSPAASAGIARGTGSCGAGRCMPVCARPLQPRRRRRPPPCRRRASRTAQAHATTPCRSFEAHCANGYDQDYRRNRDCYSDEVGRAGPGRDVPVGP